MRINFLAILVLTLVIFIAISIGPIHISLSEVVKSFLNVPGKLTGIRQTVLFDIRLPRVLLALIVGSALATSGAVYQTVFRNPLADPYLLGAAAGAGLGATIALTNSNSDISNLLPIFAFLGALLAVLISFLFAGRFFNEPSTLLLAGIAISSFATAVQTYLQQRHSTSLRPVYSWILGELTTANWRTVIWSGFYVSISLTILFIIRKKLDALLLSDDEAFSLGINSSQLRFIALGAATLATATAVAASGLIGFVGIVIPHLVKGMTHRVSNVNLPLVAIFGAAFLILADLGARTFLSPAELPIGVLTAFIGAPFFFFILRKSKVNS